ncbi:enhanced intracellular survival protein Eis [Streptomyces sp. NPDC048567]|uniref:GNAT family N-acetyltransferase n=1 Tax=Streptomyces sp. NPDC048567 TaxID=3365570 RepID=UPI00371067CF
MPDRTLFTEVVDDDHWQQYDSLAARSYGHPVDDIALLRPHADIRLAVRDGHVVAGGLGLLLPQFFGGAPVPSALLGAGCVAPEERGAHLSVRMISERLRPLRDQGAVISTLWTASSGYARRLGWEAPTHVYSWAVPTDELKRRFTETGFEITHGTNAKVRLLQNDLAAWWNGTWQRPEWWADWQEGKHPGLTTYRFNRPGQEPTGVLCVANEPHPIEGRQVVVHDFWAADQDTAAAMFAFLGRHNSRIPTVAFQRTGLPPGPLLLHRLDRPGSLTARSWHPWMLRILDLRRAVQLRGWPDEVELTLPIEIVTESGEATERYTLRITGGKADLEPTTRAGQITLTRGQFAVWYAGGYRSTAAATLAGVAAPPRTVARFLAATTDREPWLADHF